MYSFSKYKDQYKSNLRLALPVVTDPVGADPRAGRRQPHGRPLRRRRPRAAGRRYRSGGAVFFILFIAAVGIALGLTPLDRRTLRPGRPTTSRPRLPAKRRPVLHAARDSLVGRRPTWPSSRSMYHLGQPVEVVDMAIPYYKMLALQHAVRHAFFPSPSSSSSKASGNTRVEMVVAIHLPTWPTSASTAVFIYGRLGLPELGADGCRARHPAARASPPRSDADRLLLQPPQIPRLSSTGFSPRNYSWAKRCRTLLRMGLPISLQMFLEASAFVGTGIMMGWLEQGRPSAPTRSP